MTQIDDRPRSRTPQLRVQVEKWRTEDPGELDWSTQVEMPAAPRRGDYVEVEGVTAHVEVITWTPDGEDTDVIVSVR